MVEASDSSPEMVGGRAGAGDRRGGAATCATGSPRPDTDVVVSNAVLQWVPGHDELLARWVTQLPHGAWLAFQVPGNFDAPSHVRMRELAAAPRWRDRLAPVVLREDDAVLDPAGYAALLSDAGCEVDAWETTYLQRLTGEDPVLEWVTGTALRPIRDALPDAGLGRSSVPSWRPGCGTPTRDARTAPRGSRSAASSRSRGLPDRGEAQQQPGDSRRARAAR